MYSRLVGSLGILLAALAAAPTAKATEYQTMAAGACKSALPAFDGNIRSRPLAMQNEGNATAFVSCAQQGNLDVMPTQLAVAIVNNTAAVAFINCTLVTGTTSPTYYTITVTSLPGFDALGVVRPTAPDTRFTSSNAAWSCALPPGIGISRIAAVRPI